MKEFRGDALINEGFGTIGLVFFIILVITVYCLRLAEKKAGNTPKKGFRNVIYISVFLWGIYTFVTFIITNPLTDATWSTLKRYAVLLSLLVIVIERTRNKETEEKKKEKIKWYKKKTQSVISFLKRAGSLLNQGKSLIINWQIETLVVKVVGLFKRKIADIIYSVSGINAILLSIAIVSPDTLIPLTHLTAGLLADVVNDILGIIAVMIAGIDASVSNEKK